MYMLFFLEIVFIFPHLKQLLDAVWSLIPVCFVDDFNGFKVDRVLAC